MQHQHKIPKFIGRIHFIGIGGIGMSGIAEVLLNYGYQISGSDMAESPIIERLRDRGAKIFIGHHGAQVEGAAVVVISSAVKRDNIELTQARALSIPVVKRAEMLAELMRFKRTVAVAGTHGKTTTTSMMGQLLQATGYEPTIINGGILNAVGSNAMLGAGDWLVAEADESDGSFLRLPTDIAIITNIDPEHLDYYGSVKNLHMAFRQFIENLPFYGFAVLCYDHPVVRKLMGKIEDRRIISYGFYKQAMIFAHHLRMVDGKQYFNVTIRDPMHELTSHIDDICLPIAGRHNVQNALAALAVGYGIGIPLARMRQGFIDFKGVKRRFSLVEQVEGVDIIDDYAHHPTEIHMVLDTARSLCDGRVFAIMQPHRYSRLQDLMDDFAKSLQHADYIWIAPVYAAGEAEIEGINAENLVKKIKEYGHKQADYLQDEHDLPAILYPQLKAGDMVLFMGAGSITKWAYGLPEALRDLQKDGEMG